MGEPTVSELIEEAIRKVRDNPGGREQALVITKLEEAQLWAEKAGIK